MVYLIYFLDLFVGILFCFYDFIKSFKVSLHLGLLHWNVTPMLERILVWRFVVLCCRNGLWCCWTYMELSQIILREFISGEVLRWCYRPYHLIYCLCGTVGLWVKVPKALEEDTSMWLYGVGPALGFMLR